ncbi:MAG: Mrr restriction system protein [Thermoguttaceae bacterium]|nr:Mrr restriction system protein [Thermoguttaceae bacterium]
MGKDTEQKIDKRIPRYTNLIQATFNALKILGGSGTNGEILNQIIRDLKIPDEVADISHRGNPNKSELAYQADWARTYLNRYGVIENSARAVWSIRPNYISVENLDEKAIVATITKENRARRNNKTSTIETGPDDDDPTNDYAEYPEELKPWRERLAEILQNMDPFGFERLTQRVLRECGFTQVEVTKKSGDGGIDGTGKLRINGVFSFNVAFQCKRYKGAVGAPDIRDFRGSLTTDIEKGVMITTGSFSKAAREEASNQGKQQIDLIDGEEFITKIAEFGIGVRPVTTYEIDEEFFEKI